MELPSPECCFSFGHDVLCPKAKAQNLNLFNDLLAIKRKSSAKSWLIEGQGKVIIICRDNEPIKSFHVRGWDSIYGSSSYRIPGILVKGFKVDYNDLDIPGDGSFVKMMKGHFGSFFCIIDTIPDFFEEKPIKIPEIEPEKLDWTCACGMNLKQWSKNIHDPDCPFPKSHIELNLKFQEIIKTSFEGSKCSFLVSPDLILVRPASYKTFLSGLKSPDWNNISKSDLGGRKIVFDGFSVDWKSEEQWDDLFCLEWFYQVYGRANVIGPEYYDAHAFQSSELDYNNFMQKMEKKYPIN